MSDVKLTGLADLDNLLSTSIGNEPMPIDKNMFDAIILPLLVDDLKTEKPLTVDERFEHLKNIWINYYREHAKKNNLAIDANAVPTRDPRTPVKAITSNGVFHPMVIIDIEGNVVDTPSLQPHIVASIEKRISAESDRLLALEDSLKEDIRRQEELEAKALNSVMYNW